MKNILLVDDHTEIYNTLEMIIDPRQFSITHIKNTETLKKKLPKLKNISLILLDLMLSNKSGIDFIKPLKKHLKSKVVVISADKSVESIVASMKAGAADYITKPFSKATILKTLKEHIR